MDKIPGYDNTDQDDICTMEYHWAGYTGIRRHWSRTELEQQQTRNLRMVPSQYEHGTPLAPLKILGRPQKSRGHVKKKYCQGAQLEHTYKPYTGGQLTGYIPVRMRWRTRHGTQNTDNMQFFVWHGSQNLCQTMMNSKIFTECLHPLFSYTTS